jgi:hypothetical protein
MRRFTDPLGLDPLSATSLALGIADAARQLAAH